MKILKTLILFSVVLSFSVNALLEVNIIKSREELFPVVIAPFKVVGDANQGADITNIIIRIFEYRFVELFISDFKYSTCIRCHFFS